MVGDVNVDVLVEVRAPFSHASDTHSSIVTAPGGAAANQAVAMSDAGARVAIVAAVGSDPLADAVVATLRASGVDTGGVQRAAAQTGVVIALVEPDGQRSMLTDRGANLDLDPAATASFVSGARSGAHLHLTGYVLYDEASREAGLAALGAAREAGMTVSVDGSSAGPLRAAGAGRVAAWCRGADWLTCNLEEAEALTGAVGPDSAAEGLAELASEAVVTLGADGVIVVGKGSTVRMPAAHPASVADTTGAGDAFTGTYLAMRLAGDDVRASLDAALAASAAVVARRGAREWL